ncbi:MAG: carbohydrate-binding domain-containing protein [bacterium]
MKGRRLLFIALTAAAALAAALVLSRALSSTVRFTVHSNLAQYHEARKNYPLAIRHYHEAARIFRERQILKHLVNVYAMDMKRFGSEPAEALGPAGTERKARAIIARAPENPLAYMLLGRFFQSRALYARAEEQYDRALEINPHVLPHALQLKAHLEYEYRRNVPGAIALFEKSCGKDVRKLNDIHVLPKLYYLDGRAAEKESFLRAYAARHSASGDPGVLEALGYAHLALGNVTAANGAFARALQKRITSGMILGYRTTRAALLIEEAKKTPPAKERIYPLLETAVNAHPPSWKRAVEVLIEKRLEDLPDGAFPGLHFAMGNHHGASGMTAGMESEYVKALKSDPGHFPTIAALEKHYRALGWSFELNALLLDAKKHETAVIEQKDFRGVRNGTLLTSGSFIADGVKLLSGDVTVSVHARGTPAAGSDPVMVVRLDDAFVGSAPVGNRWEWYSFDASVATGAHLLEIFFPNDAWFGGADDRNLFVRQIRIRRK